MTKSRFINDCIENTHIAFNSFNRCICFFTLLSHFSLDLFQWSLWFNSGEYLFFYFYLFILRVKNCLNHLINFPCGSDWALLCWIWKFSITYEFHCNFPASNRFPLSFFLCWNFNTTYARKLKCSSIHFNRRAFAILG